jgi:NAD(P)-dependent dehydrogenase (short-subunit alcohol dehydrogenase family)
MKNKICLVTGANSGIGKVTALEIARKGVVVGLVCRNAEKAEAARKEIILQSGNEQIEIFLCDFSVQAQIRQVAEAIQKRYDKVDVLVNNAGFIASNRETTPEGYEMTFAVNHLGYFMLTNLLKDALLASPESRVVNVSSEAHRFTHIDFNNLQLERGYNSLRAYALSKLCNILFTRELARRCTKTTLTTNCLHPGAVATNFANTANSFFKFLFKFGKHFLLSPEQGAQTMIYLATESEAAQYNGAYFEKKKTRSVSAEALSDEHATRLWELSEEMTGLIGQTF